MHRAVLKRNAVEAFAKSDETYSNSATARTPIATNTNVTTIPDNSAAATTAAHGNTASLSRGMGAASTNDSVPTAPNNNAGTTTNNSGTAAAHGNMATTSRGISAASTGSSALAGTEMDTAIAKKGARAVINPYGAVSDHLRARGQAGGLPGNLGSRHLDTDGSKGPKVASSIPNSTYRSTIGRKWSNGSFAETYHGPKYGKLLRDIGGSALPFKARFMTGQGIHAFNNVFHNVTFGPETKFDITFRQDGHAENADGEDANVIKSDNSALGTSWIRPIRHENPIFTTNMQRRTQADRSLSGKANIAPEKDSRATAGRNDVALVGETHHNPLEIPRPSSPAPPNGPRVYNRQMSYHSGRTRDNCNYIRNGSTPDTRRLNSEDEKVQTPVNKPEGLHSVRKVAYDPVNNLHPQRPVFEGEPANEMVLLQSLVEKNVFFWVPRQWYSIHGIVAHIPAKEYIEMHSRLQPFETQLEIRRAGGL